MTVEISKECEEVLDRLVKSGRFQNASDAVSEALKSFETAQSGGFPYSDQVGYPPGALLHLYKEGENEAELQLVRSREKKLEAF
jgi:Arc/MetJ-type ribon-helix-helix transcriptional regulator